MRVYLLIFRSRLFTPAIVEHVAVTGDFEIVGVGGVGARRGGSGKWLSEQVAYWGFWGTFWIAGATLFRALPELLRFPRAFRRMSSLRSACQVLEIPYEDVGDVNDPAVVRRLEAMELDVVVSFQQQIFRRDLLQLPRLGCLNVHTGILPGYRGFKPVFWMQSRGEPKLGVTVHTMTDKVDAGRVVAQRSWRRRAGSSVLENQWWSYRCAAQCIVEAIEALPLADTESLPAIEFNTPYFRSPTKVQRDSAIAGGTRLL